MRTTSICLVTLLSTAAVALPVQALADPVGARNVTTGTAGCGTAGTFAFVVTGNSGKGTAWNPAFATSVNGRALFHPTTLDLTFTGPDGTFVDHEAKATGPGPVTCTISAAPAPGFTLSGTVTGWLTPRG